jgi:hypothetical protein
MQIIEAEQRMTEHVGALPRGLSPTGDGTSGRLTSGTEPLTSSTSPSYRAPRAVYSNTDYQYYGPSGLFMENMWRTYRSSY